MKKFTPREKAKMLLLCMTSINLGLSSELIWLGLVFFAAFMVVFFRYDASRVPVYRKSIAYGLIVPFAIWWVLSPEVEFGISPWLVYIPAYYLLSLALLQVRSLGNGGHDVFILFRVLHQHVTDCFPIRDCVLHACSSSSSSSILAAGPGGFRLSQLLKNDTDSCLKTRAFLLSAKCRFGRIAA